MRLEPLVGFAAGPVDAGFFQVLIAELGENKGAKDREDGVDRGLTVELNELESLEHEGVEEVYAVAPESKGVKESGEGFGGFDEGDADPAHCQAEDDKDESSYSGDGRGVGHGKWGEDCGDGCNQGAGLSKGMGFAWASIEKDLCEEASNCEKEEVVEGKHIDRPLIGKNVIGAQKESKPDTTGGEKCHQDHRCSPVSKTP